MHDNRNEILIKIASATFRNVGPC